MSNDTTPTPENITSAVERGERARESKKRLIDREAKERYVDMALALSDAPGTVKAGQRIYGVWLGQFFYYPISLSNTDNFVVVGNASVFGPIIED